MKSKLIILLSFILFGNVVLAQTAVTAGDNTLSAAIKAAASGDVLVLASGGVYTESVDSVFIIDKALSIVAADDYTTRPVVKNISNATGTDISKADFFLLKNASSLILKGIELDGGEADTSVYRSASQIFVMESVDGIVVDSLILYDCHLHHFSGRILSGDAIVTMTTFRAEKSEFNYVKRISAKSGSLAINNFYMENCTMWDFADQGLYIDAGTGALIINHSTFDNIGHIIRDNSSDDDMIRIRANNWDTISITNCILTNGSLNDDGLQIDSDSSLVPIFVSNIADYNTGGIKGGFVKSNIFADNPLYTDATIGDFTLTAASPYLTAGTDSLALGDLRWGPEVVASVANEGNMPRQFALDQNFPNPFNPETTIGYTLREAAHVKISIYNIIGHEIATIVNDYQPAGYRQTQWNGTDNSGQKVSGGMYLYQIQAGNFTKTMKMVLLK